LTHHPAYRQRLTDVLVNATPLITILRKLLVQMPDVASTETIVSASLLQRVKVIAIDERSPS